jgi:hypothetical protein
MRTLARCGSNYPKRPSTLCAETSLPLRGEAAARSLLFQERLAEKSRAAERSSAAAFPASKSGERANI